MSELKPNTECRICGKKYYSCKTCTEINHWKAVACCPEHFAQYVEIIANVRNETNKEEVMNKEIFNVVENKDDVKRNEETVEIATVLKEKIKRSKISEES